MILAIEYSDSKLADLFEANNSLSLSNVSCRVAVHDSPERTW